MAFFKFRLPGQSSSALASEAVHSAPAESLEVLRQRARHRLIGSVVLVLAAVIGFPLLFDTQPRPMSVDTPIVIPERHSSASAASTAASLSSSATASTSVAGAVSSQPNTASASTSPLPASGVLDANEEVVSSSPRASEPAARPALTAQSGSAASSAAHAGAESGAFKVDFGKPSGVAPVASAPAASSATTLTSNSAFSGPSNGASLTPSAAAAKAADSAKMVAEAKPESKPEAKFEAKSEAKSDRKPENKPDIKAEAKADHKTESKADSKSDGKNDTKARDDAAKARALLEGKEPAKSSDERLVIQVGAYSDAAKMREARQKLEAAGFKTYTQVIEGKDGKRTRVRVGPFESKAEADKSAQKIRKLQLDTAILKL